MTVNTDISANIYADSCPWRGLHFCGDQLSSTRVVRSFVPLAGYDAFALHHDSTLAIVSENHCPYLAKHLQVFASKTADETVLFTFSLGRFSCLSHRVENLYIRGQYVPTVTEVCLRFEHLYPYTLGNRAQGLLSKVTVVVRILLSIILYTHIFYCDER